MSNEIEDFRRLMNRIRAGDADAAWELVECYGEALRRAVRRTLHQKLRSKFDSQDFVQLVWSSFFRVPAHAERFERPEELAAFLVAMARNKVGLEVRRRLMTEKFNANREDSLEEKGPAIQETFIDRQPTPPEIAVARERWNQMLLDKPERYRKIICLRLQGHTFKDIADTVDLAERTVRRFLRRLSAKNPP